MTETYSGNVGNIYIPQANENDYVTGATSLRQTLITLADDCYSSGNLVPTAGIQDAAITTVKVADGAITSAKLASGITLGVIANNTFLQGRDVANGADLDIFKVNTSDLLQIDMKLSQLRIENNYYITGRNVANSAYKDIVKIDTNDDIAFGSQISVFNVKNDTNITIRNYADSANLNVLKANTSDKLVFGTDIATLNMAHNTYMTGTDAAGTGTVNIMKINTSDVVEFAGNVTATGINLGDETMSTYDVGTFTPAITGTSVAPDSVTYTRQQGQYLKIGQLVFISFEIILSAFTLGSGAGNLRISGLPFTVANFNSNFSQCMSVHVENVNLTTTTPVQIAACTENNTTTMVIRESQDNGAGAFTPLSGIGASSIIRVTGTYTADS